MGRGERARTEVPRDLAVRVRSLELLEEGVRCVAIDVHLGHHRVRASLVTHERAHFGVGARLLAAELVAGECQHHQLVAAELRGQLSCFREGY